MVLVIPLIGILFYLALFIVALVVFGIIWVLGGLLVGLADLTARVTGRKGRLNAPPKAAVIPKRKVPRVPHRADTEAKDASEIWPKWTPSHRRYMDRELSIWQEQFDALNSRE